MSRSFPIPFLQRRDPLRRWRVALGFVIVAGLIGIGVVPARKGLTVRFTGEPARRSSRSRAQHKRPRRRHLLSLGMLARGLRLPPARRRRRRR